MLDKMYDVMDSACEKANDVTGVSVKFPRPGKRSLKASVVTNAVTGTGCIIFGMVTPYKWTIILGGLGIASSVIINSKTKSL